MTVTTAKSTKPKQTADLTPAREAAAMTFAGLHHPELADLLTRLKKRKKRNQYNQAVKELFETSERLARLREKAPDRYGLALEAWKLDSRIRLLAARMTMRNNTRLEEQLTKLLRDRVDVRLRRLTQDRDRLAGRLGKVDQSIEEIRRDPEAAALRDLKRIKRTLAAKTPRAKKTQRVNKKTTAPPNPKRKPAKTKSNSDRL